MHHVLLHKRSLKVQTSRSPDHTSRLLDLITYHCNNTEDIREHMLYQDRLVVDYRLFPCKMLHRANRLYRLAQLFASSLRPHEARKYSPSEFLVSLHCVSEFLFEVTYRNPSTIPVKYPFLFYSINSFERYADSSRSLELRASASFYASNVDSILPSPVILHLPLFRSILCPIQVRSDFQPLFIWAIP